MEEPTNQNQTAGLPVEFLPNMLRPGVFFQVIDPNLRDIDQNLLPVMYPPFRDFRSLRNMLQDLLNHSERDALDTLELARLDREAFYQRIRARRQPGVLRRGRVRPDSLHRRTPLVPYVHKMQATKRRLTQLCQQAKQDNSHSLAKSAGCSHLSARKACFDMIFIGEVVQYQVNQHHPTEAVDRLNVAIDAPRNYYNSAADYKRQFPQFSKKFIRKRIKATGKRYRKIPTTPTLMHDPDENRTLGLLSTITRAFNDPSGTILWFDVSEFPLNSITYLAWQGPNDQLPPVRRRSVVNTLYLLAICNKEQFVAYQILSRPPGGDQIRFFLRTVLQKAALPQRVVVLLDNSRPNTAARERSNIHRYLLYNIEYCPQYNLIEMTFSKIKAEWRKRPNSPLLQDHYAFLLNSIDLANQPNQFAGFRKNYLKEMLKRCHLVGRNEAPARQRLALQEHVEEIFIEED